MHKTGTDLEMLITAIMKGNNISGDQNKYKY